MRAMQERSKLREIFFGTFRCALLALFTFAPIPCALAHDDGRPLALRDVALEQRLGAEAPLDAEFRDESGRAAPLGGYFRDPPGVLAFSSFPRPGPRPPVSPRLLQTPPPLSFTAGNQFHMP